MIPPRRRDPDIAEAWGSSTIARLLAILAVPYLLGVWLDAAWPRYHPEKYLPLALNYYLQIAALFPRSATMAIDYRAEAWICSEKKWVEIDTRPYFPIDRDDKENRFQRVMHFYREERQVMQSLEQYVMESHNARPAGDGIPDSVKIAGVRFSSLRLPLPKPGDAPMRTDRRPLASYPAEQRHDWYWTRRSKRMERCGGGEIDE